MIQVLANIVRTNKGHGLGPLKNDALFFVAWGTWIAVLVIKDTYAFPHDSLTALEKVTMHLPFFMLALYELGKSEEYGFKDIVFLCAIAIVVVSTTISEDRQMAKVALFIYCARRLDIRTILLFTPCVLVLVCSGVILAASLGVIEMGVVGERTARFRLCLGFQWANRPLDYLLAVLLM